MLYAIVLPKVNLTMQPQYSPKMSMVLPTVLPQSALKVHSTLHLKVLPTTLPTLIQESKWNVVACDMHMSDPQHIWQGGHQVPPPAQLSSH